MELIISSFLCGVVVPTPIFPDLSTEMSSLVLRLPLVLFCASIWNMFCGVRVFIPTWACSNPMENSPMNNRMLFFIVVIINN
ncbi:hypothetical protein [Dysgonomonas sp. HGC4]|uniref:hypothetical protein n=1 Tax=Dysgonomonas sp. HGC4 TaxID=1658009 RepID=UPI0012F83DB9|nr:hypothetical protein [Dysgonomonas sp. HGC4]MBD8346792.1 hypothetical protein [Dysgonomonas sp. HGC4]